MLNLEDNPKVISNCPKLEDYQYFGRCKYLDLEKKPHLDMNFLEHTPHFGFGNPNCRHKQIYQHLEKRLLGKICKRDCLDC